jgi:hypothetical protein
LSFDGAVNADAVEGRLEPIAGLSEARRRFVGNTKSP